MSRNACLSPAAFDALVGRLERKEAYLERLEKAKPQPSAVPFVAPPTEERGGEVIRLADGLAIGMEDVELVHVDLEGNEVKEQARTYRVKNPIEWMVERGLLSQEQARAGRKLHEAYALGVCGARNAERGVGNGRKEFGLGDAQLIALQDFRKVMAWLTPQQRGVLFRVCCWDMPVKRVAKLGRCRPTRVTELLRDGLDRVSEYFP